MMQCILRLRLVLFGGMREEVNSIYICYLDTCSTMQFTVATKYCGKNLHDSMCFALTIANGIQKDTVAMSNS